MMRYCGLRFVVARSSWVRFGILGFDPAVLDVEWLCSVPMGGAGCGMARLGADMNWLGSLRRVGILAVLGVVWSGFLEQGKVCLCMVLSGSVSLAKDW